MSRPLFRILISFFVLITVSAVNVYAAGNGFLYALRNVNGGANQIFGFRVNEITGELAALNGFPVDTGGLGSNLSVSEHLAYDQINGRLYALNEGSTSISAYNVNPRTGALTPLPFSPIGLGFGNWHCLAVHPSGSPLVAGSGSGNLLVSFNIAGGSATTAAGSPFATGAAAPFSCAFSQDGSYVYSGGNSGSAIAGFSVNAGTGVLMTLSGSPFESGSLSSPMAYATDDVGRLFVSNFNANQVRVFTTSGGLPSPVLTSPFVSGLTEGVHGVLHPAGYYLVADRVGNRVGMYRISGNGPSTTLTAVPGSPFLSGGTTTNILALNQSGAFLFAANGDSRNLTTFAVNAGTGALTGSVTQPAGTLGASGRITGLVYANQPEPPNLPGSGFVYTLEDLSGAENRIHGFGVNELTGALTALNGFPVGTGGNGTADNAFQRLAYDRSNSRLYVLNNGSDTVSVYEIDRVSGLLTPLSFSPINLGPGNWHCLAVHPDGTTLLAGDLLGPLVSFHITAGSAVAAPGNPFASGASPDSCAFSQDGLYVYAGGPGTNIAGVSVAGSTGMLTALPGSPFNSGNNPIALATDRAGRLFSSDQNGGQLRVFTTSAGVPSPVPGNPFPSGLTQAPHGVLHPAGYYFVSDRIGNRVGAFRVERNGPSTLLPPVSGSPFASGGSTTNILALNQNGTFLFSANASSRNVTSYAVTGTTGVLNGVYKQPLDTAGTGGFITGLVYAQGLNHLFLPLIKR
ncbi:MAG: beta-propeller fold lactonase family protein [Deltaproteobacteria bacterium]|nr:beta-propeller fold lactonase family protein [Deltaproteobacteria bacterium]